MQRWEYTRAVGRSSEDLIERANELGEQGWEMIAVYVFERAGSSLLSKGGPLNAVAYFKRPAGAVSESQDRPLFR